MPVWSEIPRYEVNFAPSIFAINNAINAGPLIRIANTALQVSESLAELAFDAANGIIAYWTADMLGGNPMPVPVGSDKDAWDMILQLVYYADLVLSTVDVALVGTALHNQPLHQALQQNMHNIMICAYLAAAHLRDSTTPPAQLGNDQELLAFRALLAATNLGGPCPPISGLGTVELLCRVIARGCLTIGAFAGIAQLLRIRRLPRPAMAAPFGWWDCHNKAIPKTVFVCSGSNSAVKDKSAMFVVTTSQDEWGGFNIMQNFATRCRQPLRRLDWNAVGGGVQDPLGMVANSLTLRGQYNNADAGLLAPVTDNDRRNARRPIRDNWVHRQDHRSECATPFQCPSFQPKSRCLRCQAFFDYNVVPQMAMAPLEFTVLGDRHLKSHLARACAECIAHYACLNAKANHGFFDGLGRRTH